MKAPVPPPTMPRRILRDPFSAILSPLHPEDLAVRRAVGAGGGEVVEGPLGDADDVARNERRPLGSALLGMLQRAFPFEHGPAVEVVAGKGGEDRREVHLAVAGRAEAPCPLHPRL